MRRGARLPGACAALLVLGAATAARAQAPDTEYVIEQLSVSVAAQPDGSGDRIATLRSGDAVQVIEHQEDRAHVRLASGAEGWVKASYLTAGPPLRLQLQQRTHELEELKQRLAGVEGELAQARAHPAVTAAAPAAEASVEPRVADAPLFSGMGESFRPGWAWLIAVALAALGAGFLLGWRVLDRRIRRKYGGLRIY